MQRLYDAEEANATEARTLTEAPKKVEFTTSEAAEWLRAHGLNRSQATVIREVDAGALAARRTKGGHRRIRLSALESYLRDHS